MKRIKRPLRLISVFLLVCAVLSSCAEERYYYAEDFGIETVLSEVDYNGNGIDDYTDFLNGARKDAKKKPKYDDRYFEGGYPPDNIGVCADVIWRAFKEAGYSLRDMMDKDISKNLIAYSKISVPDTNIDFRRVVNLKVFFSRHAQALTTDIDEIDQWQPGDIVIFGNNTHIGIVSDKRNADGQPYIIHNGGQEQREQDYLSMDTVTAHFRFDASAVEKDVLCPWKD